MGISVISSPSLSTAAVAGTPLNAGTAEALPVDFASLLSGQLSLTATTKSTEITDSASDSEVESVPGNENTDPTLALLLAIPAATPPIQANHDVHLDTTLSGSAKQSAESAGLLRQSGLAQEESTERVKTGADSLSENILKAGNNQVSENFTESLKNALNAPRSGDIQPETANIAVESANQAASAALAAHAQPGKRAAEATSAPEVRTPLQSQGWSQDFSEKVVWLAKNDQQSAHININPPQLGPVQITLQINGDQATATFASPHPEVRQAIEASLSDLKAMLSNAGINLGQTDIGANLAQQQRDTPSQTANGNRSADENAILAGNVNAPSSALSTPIQRGRGLVDLFA